MHRPHSECGLKAVPAFWYLRISCLVCGHILDGLLLCIHPNLWTKITNNIDADITIVLVFLNVSKNLALFLQDLASQARCSKEHCQQWRQTWSVHCIHNYSLNTSSASVHLLLMFFFLQVVKQDRKFRPSIMDTIIIPDRQPRSPTPDHLLSYLKQTTCNKFLVKPIVDYSQTW